jgi:nucleotide-binding universal stress UspA family protein
MTQRILVAADDSPAGLEAARWAVDLAGRYGAALRVLHVLADSDVTRALGTSGSPGLAERRRAAVRSLFRHVSGLAAAAAVEVETVELSGEPAHRILEQARGWPADLVVIGRGERHEAGGPWVGKATRMVLEFAEQPVLVVPAARSRDRGHVARHGGDH